MVAVVLQITTSPFEKAFQQVLSKCCACNLVYGANSFILLILNKNRDGWFKLRWDLLRHAARPATTWEAIV